MTARQTIRVVVSGAVERSGEKDLPLPATVRDALLAAGGLLGQGPSIRPACSVALRRPFGWDPLPEREIYEWDLHDPEQAEWWNFRLLEGDGLMFWLERDP